MFSIRYAGEEDLSFITEIRLDPEVQDNVGTLLITNKQKQKEWFNKTCADSTKMYLIFEETGLIDDKIGYVRMTDIDYVNKSVCVGADIYKNYRGKGYTKNLYPLIFDLCFNKLNMNRLWLFVLETNERAIYVYKKMGFKEEGRQRKAIYKNGKYLDYIMMSIIREEYYEGERKLGTEKH